MSDRDPRKFPNDRDFASFLARIAAAPADGGRVELIVRRPSVDQRELLKEATLDTTVGLSGDDWSRRGSSQTPDGSPHPEAQLTLISTRVLSAIEPDPERWPLAGDQIYVDFDLSMERLPAGSRLALGSAVIEVSELPHRAVRSSAHGSAATRCAGSIRPSAGRTGCAASTRGSWRAGPSGSVTRCDGCRSPRPSRSRRPTSRDPASTTPN